LLVDNFVITKMIGPKEENLRPFPDTGNAPLRLGKRGLDMSPIRVLVIEDFVAFRRVISSILGKKRELQIICEVSDGLEAVQKAEELKPDLILLDIGLPALNGIEAARQIRKRSPESKILFLSQESSADVVQEALSLGALGYVVKAHVGSDLLAAVEAVLSGKQFVSTLANDNIPSRSRRNVTPLCDTVGD
jgi:DNA-binding NarL/FixJ family response regulator